MTDPTQGLPPAGWYPDPAGAPQQRWWDGLQWTENLQPATQQAVQPAEPLAVSQPIAQQVTAPEVIDAPATFPFQPVAEAVPSRRSTFTAKNEAPDAAAKPAGRLHALALLVIGLATSAGGLALLLYGMFGGVDATVAAQTQLYGGIIAGFGAFAMLLWLAVGAIRQR